MLLPLAYLTVTNASAMLRLVPMSDRDKDAEILALRHQITVPKRRPGSHRVRFTPGDRAFLAALPHRLPPEVPRTVRPAVHPDTVLRWHRDPAAPSRRRLPAQALSKAAHRPLHPAPGVAARRRNPGGGYRRIHGEPLVLQIKVAASTGREILQEPGPARHPYGPPARGRTSRAPGLTPCRPGFPETVTLPGTRLPVFAVTGHADRHIPICGAAAHPAASRGMQAANNLVMDLKDAGCRARCLIRDRDWKHLALPEAIILEPFGRLQRCELQVRG